MRTLKDTASSIHANDVKVEIFGLGYIGFPLAVKLASAGMIVTGIDVNEDRISRLDKGVLRDTERNLSEAFLMSRKEGRLLLSMSSATSLTGKIGFICVPTPIPTDSERSDTHVIAAANRFLETSSEGDVLIVESSIETGTMDKIQDMVTKAGYRPGGNFGLAFCPERIDPQNTKWTLENIPRIVFCSDDTTYEIASNIYTRINGLSLLRVSSAKVAEVTKSFENAFRLVNVSLVNELAILCDRLGISVREVISAASSKPFGFMPFYPGAGAGGHCIPKDSVFLSESSKRLGNEFGTIENALRVNAHMPEYVATSIDAILRKKNLPKSVLICGMAYKPNTDDMRDSPGFKIARELIGMGYHVGTYDPFFKISLLSKYLKENAMPRKQFDVVDGLMSEGFSCLCIVQHHSRIAPLLQDAYANSKFPVIYDCQGRIRHRTGASTLLRCLGS